jgi:hypothetical protein
MNRRTAGGPSRRDLEDAVDHMADFADEPISLDDFDISRVEQVKVRDLDRYDDIDSWLDLDEGELLDLDPDEREDEIIDLRGRYALDWTPRTVPPIVIVELDNGYQAVADGRGRVNIAVGMDWPIIPAVFLTPKKNRRAAMPAKKRKMARELAKRYMQRTGFNKYNAPEVMNQLLKALYAAELDDVAHRLKQLRIPQIVNDAWQKR